MTIYYYMLNITKKYYKFTNYLWNFYKIRIKILLKKLLRNQNFN